MRFLVTGGAGFIGSHLVHRLHNEGHTVYVIDDFSTGTEKNLPYGIPFENIIPGRVQNQIVIPYLNDLMYEIDVVFHMAATVGVKNVMENSIDTIENNVGALQTILRYNHNNAKIVYASSSEVYGSDQQTELSEYQSPIIKDVQKKRNAYACSKLMGEFMALSYFKEKGMPVTVARLFNTVGERQSSQYGMVIPTFVHRVLVGAPMIVHGDGSQMRSFIHVDDTVEGLIRLSKASAADGHIFNIGNPDNEISIIDLAEYIGFISDMKFEIIQADPSQFYGFDFDDIQRRVPDISKIKALTFFEPRKSLANIVTDVFDHYKPKVGD